MNETLTISSPALFPCTVHAPIHFTSSAFSSLTFLANANVSTSLLDTDQKVNWQAAILHDAKVCFTNCG